MQYKEDMEDAKNRLAAWWNHESIDRPVISYSYPKPNGKGRSYDHWFLAKNQDNIADFIKSAEIAFEDRFFGGEHIPNIFLNYGPGVIACVLGATAYWRAESETVWFERPTKLEDVVQVLENVKLNANNEWYNRIMRVTEYAASHSGGRYSVSFTDIGGVMDILASFLTPKDLILAMMRKPQIIHRCRAIILEKILRIYDDLEKIFAKYNLGYNAWMSIWCPKPWYPIQCDFCYMLSPKLFREFVLPDIQAQAAHMKYAIYHLDGPGELPFVDDLLKVPEITGIQWVPGVQNQIIGQSNGADCWMPLYKKIQAAGKNLVLDPPEQWIAKCYKQLDPRGLYCSTGFGSYIMAEFWLPKFIGGYEGIEPEE
jgi:hypothetical protein